MRNTPADTRFATEELAQLVRAILRRKSGMSLRDDDTRRDNVDALELCQDILVRLWERFVEQDGADNAWEDVQAYAASVTHNAWADHLRQKYPRRASLKNRVRYFLGHQPRYAVWDAPQGDTLGGLKVWLLGGVGPVDPARVQALAEGRERLASGSVPVKAPERFAAGDWDRLLGALFAHLGGPVALDPLVSLVSRLLDVQEESVESLEARAEEGGSDPALADPAAADPEHQALLRGMLRQVWDAVLALKPDYRRAYLLNLPGPGKLRSDIEVFVLHGIASVAQIHESLALSAAQLDQALAALPLSELQRRQAADAGELERFALLWSQLPLSDALIAGLLGMAPQQVINRRMLALRELARMVGRGSPRAARRGADAEAPPGGRVPARGRT